MGERCTVLWLQTVRVDLLGDLQSVRGGKISVGRSHSQDKTCFLGDKLEQHVLDLRLYVNRLVSHRYLGQARQVDHGDVQHCHTQPLTTYIHLTDKFTSPKVTRNPTRQCLCHTTEEPRFYFLNYVFEGFPRFCMLFWKFLRPSRINKLFVLKKRSVFVLYLMKRLTIILPYCLTTFFVVSNKNFLKAIIQ